METFDLERRGDIDLYINREIRMTRYVLSAYSKNANTNPKSLCGKICPTTIRLSCSANFETISFNLSFPPAISEPVFALFRNPQISESGFVLQEIAGAYSTTSARSVLYTYSTSERTLNKPSGQPKESKGNPPNLARVLAPRCVCSNR